MDTTDNTDSYSLISSNQSSIETEVNTSGETRLGITPYYGVKEVNRPSNIKWNIKLKPYVERSHRVSHTSRLPWIDQFLAVTPASGVEAVLEDVVEEITEMSPASEMSEMSVPPVYVKDVAGAVSAVSVETEADDLATYQLSSDEVTNEVAVEDMDDLTYETADEVAGDVVYEAADEVGVEMAVEQQTMDDQESAHGPIALGLAGVADLSEEEPVGSDEWALEEAADELDELAHSLDAAIVDGPDGRVTADGSASQVMPDLPAWSDEDMIEIMPVRRVFFTPRAQVAQEPRSGAQAADRKESAESAAQALELLAQRVRAGELSLAGYEPRMGNAAALAAALTALLGSGIDGRLEG